MSSSSESKSGGGQGRWGREGRARRAGPGCGPCASRPARRSCGARPRGGWGAGTLRPGGARLRALREQAGKAQLWVEAEAELGTGYLQRVESGKVAQPGHATLERILAALGARYGERREVLELFGYAVATPPPTEEEVA